MAIRFETSDGKIRTIGGDDPKLKIPVANKQATQRVDASSISRSSPKTDADYARLNARVDALELLVKAQTKQIANLAALVSVTPSVTTVVTQDVTRNADTVTRNANSNAERQRRYRARQAAKPKG